MFGLTFEKLVLVAIIAGIVLGPHRLAASTRRLADTARSLRAFVDATRRRTEQELGVPLTRAEWDEIDLRQYDPRRIVGDALRDAVADRPPGSLDVDSETPGEAVPEPSTDEWEGLDRVRPGQKYLVLGDAAHPRRLLLAGLPTNDPRRVAAETPPPTEDASELHAAPA
ncbi:Sec-independent protein translocase subunit TatA/TatB [Microbacterium flavum]|uniref:Preprotein translocase n=1 Tax=Microbacterium flavum TaxID=415216 RepID=A0ABS5XTG8_9MICO|nr:hypothetical protein [Microbacterium flavum]MBT8797835.1 hypothetical protein [Microbacterium flavum]